MRVLRSGVSRILLTAALALCAASTSARASTSFEFLFSTSHVHNDSQFFLNLAVADSGFSRPALEPYLPRLRYLESDLPVVLYLARTSGRSVEFIIGLRSQGLAWSVILDRCHVAPDVLFVGIDRDPGPPYGNAWGYWKKQGRRVRLSDNDIAGLVHVQYGSRWLSTGTYDLAHNGGGRKQVVSLVANKQGHRYAQAGGGGGKGPQKSKGKGKGSGS